MVYSRFPLILIAAILLSSFRTETATARAQGQMRIELSPVSIRPGDVLRVEIDGSVDDRMTATLFGQDVPLTFEEGRRRWIGLAGVDLDRVPGSYAVRVARRGVEVQQRDLTLLSKQFAVRRLRVPDNFVNPSPEALEQIAADNKTLTAVYGLATPRRWVGAFVAPVDGQPTSNFGTRSFYNGQSRSPHAGVDFPGKTGTPIRSPNHGRIALAAPLYFTGNTVIIDHGAGLLSVLAHLSEVRVKAGDLVTADTRIGLVGATGRVTGPHLHWSVRLGGARVDPMSLIAVTQDR